MKRIVIAIAACLISILGMAQNIKGTVVDMNGLPLELANVVLLQRQDSAFVAGTSTQSDGSFSIAKPNQETFARISFLGYKTTDVAVSEDMGQIVLTEDSMVLGEVTVKAYMPKAKLQGSSLVMNIDNTVLSRIGTAADVLCQMPTVVKKSDGFEVLGKGTPLIYINGRKMRETKELTELRSDQIKSIEIDHNPGARYDATVSAVINIKTKRAIGEGFSFELGSWTRQNQGTSNNEWLDLTYRKKGLEIFANIFAEPYCTENEKNRYDETVTADTLWNIHNSERIHMHNNYYSGKIGFNYNTQKHSFGAFYQNYQFYKKTNNDAFYELTGNQQSYDNISHDLRHKNKTWPSQLANAYYNGTIGKLNIDFNADYVSMNNRNTRLYTEDSERNDSRLLSTTSTYKSRMFAEKLVATHPLWKGTIALGEEFTMTHRNNDFTNAEGVFVDDYNKTNENVIAPFVEMRQQLGKWFLSLGLRYEHTSSDYYLFGEKQADQCRTYDHLFPSISIATAMSNVRLSLSYTAKTQRPSFAQMNSCLMYANVLGYEQGNPLLKPSIINNIQLMTMWKFLFLSAGFSDVEDDIQYSIESYKGDAKVELVTYKNYDHRRNLTLTLGGMGKVGVWNPNYSLTMLKQWFTVNHVNGLQQSYNHPLFVFQLNNAFDLPHQWIFRLDYNYTTKGHTRLFYCYKPCQSLNLSLGKDFDGDRLHVQIDCTDIFGTERHCFNLNSNNFAFKRHDNPCSRSISLSLSYRFNTADSKYRGTGAGNDTKQRLQ